jgi:uncharacterized protein YaiI (UPF0178 family)
MVDDSHILAIERLRDGLLELKAAIRSKYSKPYRQVTDPVLKESAAKLAENWIVNYSQRQDIAEVVSSDFLADLNVHFQRILTLSEHSSKRSRYDFEINNILRDFSLKVIVPLKQARTRSISTSSSMAMTVPIQQVVQTQQQTTEQFIPTVFVGHSFSEADRVVVNCITETLISLGLRVVTGEKPKASRISDKVKKLIEDQHLFVGVFTKRDKIAHKKEWTTSSWVLDEKAYALGKGKKLLLLKEVGVGSIGGIQGDYEFIEFSRDTLESVPSRLISMFQITVAGLRS